jgi:hypothetical protein
LVCLAGNSQAPMITIELNQSQLAEMAGGSRQSVSQAIGSFVARGWLRTEGRRVVVTNLTALRRRPAWRTAVPAARAAMTGNRRHHESPGGGPPRAGLRN